MDNYIKLFILMGITWAFGFIAPFVNHISVWIIFICLNASQGLFIFIAFVCTKNVYDSFKTRYRMGNNNAKRDNDRKKKYVTTSTNLTSHSNTSQTGSPALRCKTSAMHTISDLSSTWIWASGLTSSGNHMDGNQWEKLQAVNSHNSRP